MKTLGSQDAESSSYTLAPGDTLGQYKIIRSLGRGGMGEVYEAENVVSRKHIALKVLPRAATGGTFVDRFRIESRVMSDLRHPHIVEVLHAGEEDGLYYLTMDLVTAEDGDPHSIEDLLQHRTSNAEHRTSKAGGLPESEVVAAAEQILDALEYAHGKGVVHRDLKPANILVAEDGTLRVTDFGLAKIVGSEYLQSVIERSISLSMAGAVSMGDLETQGGVVGGKTPSSSARALLGTYDYMAPEQKAGGEITVRTDIYAFGVMLYRMLTGRKPEGRFKMPSKFGCSRPWDGILSRCLEPDPSDRYASVSELRREIARTARRAHSWKWAAALLLLAAVAAGAWWVWQRPAVREAADFSLSPDESALEPAGSAEPDISDPMLAGARVEVASVRPAHESLMEEAREKAGQGVPAAETALRAAAEARRVGDWGARAAALRFALDESFDQSLVHAAWGAFERERGRADEAQRSYLRALALDARDAEANFGLGLLAVEAGRKAAALDYFQAAIEVDPDHADAQYHAAELYAAMRGQGRNAEERDARVQAYRDAKTAYEAALRREDRAFLDQHGTEAWRAVDRQARLGAENATDPVVGRRSYEQALSGLPGAVTEARAAQRTSLISSALAEARAAQGREDWAEVVATADRALALDGNHREAQVLKRNAEEQMVPTWHIVTTVDGREVRGTIKIGDETHASPHSLSLTEGQRYTAEFSYESGGRRYTADSVTEAANWRGERQLRVALEEQTGPRAGETRTVDLGAGVSLELVWIPPGDFLMGSPDNEEGRSDDEGPQTRVAITRGFWMGKYPITQRQYERLAPGFIASLRRMFREPSSSNYPVYLVSWYQAVILCNALQRRLPYEWAGHKVRLPTEAEWEYACRAGTTTRYYTGDSESDLDLAASYRENRPRGIFSKVGQMAPNAWGIHDLHGNVHEWCQDWYLGRYPGGEESDPVGPSSGWVRVKRGGASVSDSHGVRSAARHSDRPEHKSMNGVRVVLSLP